MNVKTDFKKVLKHLYNPKENGFHIVDVPKMDFLQIDGTGNPNNSVQYQNAVEALYSLSYGIKFAVKSPQLDYIIPPLEGLWWMKDMNEFTQANKDRWEWTMMIMQPDWVTAYIVEDIRQKVYKKKKLDSVMNVRFEPYSEGLSVQILYAGAYIDEAPTIAQMHQFIHANNYQTNGKHHEIYLGDPRKTTADKLQTILRQPIRKL